VEQLRNLGVAKGLLGDALDQVTELQEALDALRALCGTRERWVPKKVPAEWRVSAPFPVRVGLTERLRIGPSRASKSAAPHGHPAGSRVSQRDVLHPSTPRCESIGRRRSATANSTLTCRTCAECPPRGCPYIVYLVAS